MQAKAKDQLLHFHFQRFRTLYYSLYHNQIKQLLHITFLLIFCFRQQKINYSQFKKEL